MKNFDSIRHKLLKNQYLEKRYRGAFDLLLLLLF
jgi:hypothetical protein